MKRRLFMHPWIPSCSLEQFMKTYMRNYIVRVVGWTESNGDFAYIVVEIEIEVHRAKMVVVPMDPNAVFVSCSM